MHGIGRRLGISPRIFVGRRPLGISFPRPFEGAADAFADTGRTYSRRSTRSQNHARRQRFPAFFRRFPGRTQPAFRNVVRASSRRLRRVVRAPGRRLGRVVRILCDGLGRVVAVFCHVVRVFGHVIRVLGNVVPETANEFPDLRPESRFGGRNRPAQDGENRHRPANGPDVISFHGKCLLLSCAPAHVTGHFVHLAVSPPPCQAN